MTSFHFASDYNSCRSGLGSFWRGREDEKEENEGKLALDSWLSFFFKAEVFLC